jgi:type IV pilus assembly protein PilQ
MKILDLFLRRATWSCFAGSILLLGAPLLLCSQIAGAQSNRERRLLLNEYVAPEELISMSKSVPFDKAIPLFTDFSKKYLNKIIVDPLNTKKEIGVDIENMYWLQAFETVLRANSLWYEEKEEYFQIFSPQDSSKGMTMVGGVTAVAKDSVSRAMLLARDIKISTVFFSIDVSKTLNTGINWNFMYFGDTTSGKGTQFGGQFKSNLEDPTKTAATSGTTGGTGSQQTQPDAFIGKIIPNLKFSTLTGFVSFLEGNGLGDIISSPEVIVSSGKKGMIQIGSDIFVTTKDFAGNTIQQRIATGIIVSVTPTLYEQNGVRFINLDTHVENSKQNGVNIDKSSIDTYLLLNDGEETVLGGLYSTTQTTTRQGIPYLKDLPWYVFGLRYIFGSETKTDTKNELIILLRAEVVPTIQERLADKMRKNENLIEKTRKEFEEDMAKRKLKSN